MTHLAGIILQIVSCLADEPSLIKINEVSYEKHRILIVRCSRSDLGKIVGRHGRVAKAIRLISWQIGTRLGVKYDVKFEERHDCSKAG